MFRRYAEEFSNGGAARKRKRDKMPKRNKKNFRPTKEGAGMTEAGVKAYRKANPGSKLQTAVTEDKPFLKQQKILIQGYDKQDVGGSVKWVV